MPRRLLALNVLLGGVSLACAAVIVWQFVMPTATPAPRSRSAPGGAAPAPEPEAPHAPAAAYSVVATRSLFSPTRSETPATAAGSAGPAVAKPNLHGIILRDANPIAYLEDPMTKRVAGYRIGDSIVGGTVETIAADRVVIARPDGSIDVKLRDPSKPRPAAPPAAATAPGSGVAVPGQPVPPPAFTPPMPGGIPGRSAIPQRLEPGVPGAVPTPFTLPGGRPSPSLGRRLPTPPLTDAPPQQAPGNQ